MSRRRSAPDAHYSRVFVTIIGTFSILHGTFVVGDDDRSLLLKAPTVDIVGTTPLEGVGTPVEQIPSNIQSVTAEDIARQRPVNLAELINRQLGSVTVSEIQGNPYQPDVSYRGFSISPLLGTPQGLSVYQDGVRVNEPFGDVVNWDLIPQTAVSSINIIPGSNPLFGLNTLGGALSVRTKNGTEFPGTSIQGYTGPFDRRAVEITHGSASASGDLFVAVEQFDEDGWRDFSSTEVTQFFAKIGRPTSTGDIDFSITHAATELTGNGLVPMSLYRGRHAQVFTVPDTTINRMTLLNLTASQAINSELLVFGNIYFRQNRSHTLNGDTNDDFEEDPALDGAVGANGGLGFNLDTGANNRTRTDQERIGLTLQLSGYTPTNQYTAGVSYDSGDSDFEQSVNTGVFDIDRRVLELAAPQIENRLSGRTRTRSLYFTDTYTVTPRTHVTLSGRYNRTRVQTSDRLNLMPPNLDGDFTYRKFNPAIGVTHKLYGELTAFGGYSQGNRAPTPIELGCADPSNPCTLPNALASDPFLKQVVARTFEAGLRRSAPNRLSWNVSAFRTVNMDDILFVSSSTSAGFFTNFGRTRRQGIETGVRGIIGATTWAVNYSYVEATFESSARLVSENNSSRGTTPGATDDEIRILPGDRIPGVPEHQFKFMLDYAWDDHWAFGADVLAASRQYARGNENNRHRAGTFTDNFGNARTFLGLGEIPGYAVLNVNTRYRPAKAWELFVKIDNLLGKKFFTASALAENPFDASGSFRTNSDDWVRESFVAPGAPRAVWFGARYTLGSSSSKI